MEFNKKDVILFFCDSTSAAGFNSGIQRYTKKLAVYLLESGIKLIPVVINENKELVLPDMNRLEIFSSFGGPSQNSWPAELFHKSKEELFDSASHIINPELTDHLKDGELATLIKGFTNKGIQYVSVLHDAIAVKQSQFYSKHEQGRSMRFMNEISNSDVIISVSESTRKDYHSLVTDYHNKNVKSISLLLPREIFSDNLPNPKINDKKDINILCVSSFEKRKNHLLLLESFKYAKNYLSKNGYTLNLKFIAAYKSGDQDFMDKIYKKAEELHVQISIGASENELEQSYLEADFSIYPSLYEGFGFPIAESLSFNTPVICSNTSSMIEIAESLGHSGIKTFDPSDSRALGDLIIQMTLDSGLRHEMAKQIANIKPVSWSDYVEKFLNSI